MIKKINIFLVLLLLLLSIGAVSAADDMDGDVMSSDEAVSDIVASDVDESLSVDVADEELLTSSSHIVNSSTYNNYFNSKGNFISSSINEGDTLMIDGNFNGKEFIFRTPVNVVGTSTNNMKNCVFTFYSNASGSSVSNLKIANTEDYKYGIFLNGASNCVIHDCFINNTGSSSYTICVANQANYNNVSNNVLNAYGMTYGHGTRSTPPLLLCNAHYNYIGDNTITCDDANAIYLSSFEGGPLSGGESNFNIIHNNIITYNVLPTSWAYGIQVMGSNNTISSNRIIGAYRGISTSNGGNVIIDNWIINLTGADYNNPGVASGGEIGIVGSYNSTIKNNHIVNAMSFSTGAGITALDGSVVENNYVEVLLQGKGIHPQGNNVLVKNNTITTNSGSGILYNTWSYNLTVLNNNISSNSGVGVLIQKVSNKRMPGNITIVGNTIFTHNKYAIDAAEANASSSNVIGPNYIPKGGGEVRTPEGSYDPSKPVYIFNGTVHNINPDNIGDYINDNGGLSSDIKDGDILNFTGEFHNRIIFVNSAIKITGDNPIFYNTTFRVSCDGVWIENLTIRNNKADRLNAWGILVYRVSGATVTNCDIEVYDPNAAYAIYVVEASDVDVLNNTLFSSGNYLTYTLLAYAVEDCNFINNTINTLGTGVVHKFESQHCLDGDTNCLDGNTNCLDGDTNCLDGDTNCLDGDTNCLDGDTNCLDGDTNCLDGDTNCLDGDTNCLDGNTVCTDGNSIGNGNHVLSEVYRTYGILMAYSSDNVVSGNIVNVTSKLNETISTFNSTNAIVGIDLYFNSHNNVFSENEIYINANDNYIYGMGVLGYNTGHTAPEGQGASNNSFIGNYIEINGTYCVEGIIIGDETEDTLIEGNIIYLKSDNVAYGITLEMSQESTISDNYLSLNSDVIYGIEAFSSNNNAMNNNELKLNAKQAYGILFSNSHANSVISNRILANVTGENIDFMNFDSIAGGNAGIFLKSNSTDNEIKKNNIQSLKGYAIRVDDEAVNNVITENCLDSEKGIGNRAVSNTQNNVVENNYKYTFTGRMSTVRVNYLETGVFTLNVDDGALVKFYIGDKEIGSAISTNGVATLNYKLDESLTPTSYKIKAVASKENYLTKEFSAILRVNKGNLNIALNDVSAKVLSTGTFIATVSDASGKPLSSVNVKFYRVQGRYVYMGEANTVNGIAKLVTEIPSVSGDEFVISANFTGNSNFNSASGQATLYINNKDPLNVALSDVSTDPNTSVTLTATVKDDSDSAVSGLNVKFYILQNGENILIGQATTDSNGAARLNYAVPSMFDGSYFISAKVDGNANYNPAVDQAILKSNKNTVDLVLNDVSSYPSVETIFTAAVKDIPGGVVSGLNVKFYMVQNGESTFIGQATTGDDGVARLSYEIPSLPVGAYIISANVIENDDYYAASEQATLNIEKCNVSLVADDVYCVYNSDDELVATLINDVTGSPIDGVNVVISINGNNHTIKTNSKGQIALSTNGLVPGSYVATISYAGNSKYNPASATANVIVSKADTAIIAPDVSVIYKDVSGELVATLINDVTGKGIAGASVVVSLNGVEYNNKTDSKGQVRVSTNGLALGSYVATISYVGNSRYNPASATANVIVSKLDTGIIAPDVSVVYQDVSGELVATLINTATGKGIGSANVVVSLNGVDYTMKTNSKGEVRISTADLNPKTYTAVISYKGNTKYNPSNTTATVIVNKIGTSLSAAYDNNANELVATLTNSITGKGISGANVVVSLNGVDYTIKTNSKGQARVSTSDLNPNTYTAKISYKGNTKYSPTSTTKKFTIKSDILINAPDVSVAYKDESGELVATLTNTVTGKGLISANVVVSLNGVDNTVKTDSKGQVRVSTSGLNPGSYVATISYAGNSKYNPASATANVIVNKANTVIIAPDVSVVYQDASGELVATLINDVAGKGISGANVVVSLNGVDYTMKTNSKGEVRISTADLNPKTYTAVISYKGNSKYAPSNTTATVIVNKISTSLSAAYDNNANELVATLTNNITGKGIGSANVVVSLNGVDYTMKTNSKGEVRVSTADLDPGNYTAIISYAGNNKYLKSSTTASVVM